MAHKNNEWDSTAASPVPQDTDAELEKADDDEDFADEDFEEEEDETAEDIEEE